GTHKFKVNKITITPTIKTEGLTTITKVYDANDSATVAAGDVVLGEVLPSDNVALTYTATYDNKNVGATKAVTVHYTAITGADAGNYSLTGDNVTGYTGAITAKELTATWGVNAFTYNGTTQAPTATLTAIAGDTITYAVTGAETNANSTVTPYTATVAFNGTGADDGNYTIKNSAQTFTIAKKAVTVAQKSGSTLTKIYDGDNICDTTFAKDTQYAIAGVEEIDKEALDITISSKVFDDANISATKVTATFILNDYGKTNYSCAATTFEHTATITPIKLTITKAPEAQQLTKAYDGLTSFAVSHIQAVDYVVTTADNGGVLPTGYTVKVQSVEFASKEIAAEMGTDNVTVTMAKTNDVDGTNLNRNFELTNTTFLMNGQIVNSNAQAVTDYSVTLNKDISNGTSGIKDGVTYASDKVTIGVIVNTYDKIRKTA
ncbi:MAG: YDG domain-containing protein, partial [Clostridia bacterium]